MTAPAFRAAGSGGTGTTTSTAVPKPAGTLAGDVLYALVVNGGAAAAPGTVPSGWTLTQGLAIGAGGWVGVYEHIAGDSEPSSYTWSGFTDSCAGSMVAISGADTTTPTHKVHATATLDSTAPTDSGVTTTVADCLIIGGVGVGDNVGVSGWTATDPATLIERTEVQSTGGNDTTSSLAAATGAQSAPGPTGTLHVTLAGSRNAVVVTIAVQPPQTSGGQSLTPGGIASAESFGGPSVTGAAAIAASGIASAAAFGSPEFGQMVAPTATGSGESFGTPVLGEAIAPAGIASSETSGTPLISAGTAIAPDGIGAGAVGTPSIGLTLAPSSIQAPAIPGDAGGQVGEPDLSSGATIAPTGIGSGSAGSPALALTITASGIGSAEAPGTPAVAVAVAPAGIGASSAFGTAALTADAVIAPAGIASAAGFGAVGLSGGVAAELPDLAAAIVPAGRLGAAISASTLAASVTHTGRLDATVT